MTNEKLREANILDDQIRFEQTKLKSIKKALKEIELSEFGFHPSSQQIVRLKLEHKECDIDKTRLLKFLNLEIEIEESNISKLEKEFQTL